MAVLLLSYNFYSYSITTILLKEDEILLLLLLIIHVEIYVYEQNVIGHIYCDVKVYMVLWQCLSVIKGNVWPLLHWASKETYHFFSAMLTKIYPIKINHTWTQISLKVKYSLIRIWKNKGLHTCMYQKGEKCGEIAKGNFFENCRNWSPSGEQAPRRRLMYAIAIHSSSMAGYVTAVSAFAHS